MNNIQFCYLCESCFCSEEWNGLCSLDCYHKMSQLLIPFEYADTIDLHPKLIKYFIKYPSGGNFYMSNSIKKYLNKIPKDVYDK